MLKSERRSKTLYDSFKMDSLAAVSFGGMTVMLVALWGRWRIQRISPEPSMNSVLCLIIEILIGIVLATCKKRMDG